MTGRRWVTAAVLLFGGIAGAKGTTTEEMTGQQEHQMAHCPSSVPGAKTVIDNEADGVALTVTAESGKAREEIRRRARVQQNVAMQSARGAIEHTGGGTGTGKFGFCPGMIQGTRVAVDELPDGARLTVRAPSQREVQSLQRMTRERLRRLEAKR